MNSITIQKVSSAEMTLLSNNFIDYYMPQANGDFVKIYIYLLRILSDSLTLFSLEEMADKLLCTERDIKRALKYWHSEKILELTMDSKKKITSITLLPIIIPESAASADDSEDLDSDNNQDIPSVTIVSKKTENIDAVTTDSQPAAPKKLSPNRIHQLKSNEDVKQLLYIIEQYFGKPLSPSEIQKVLYFYDELKMSSELIEYLIEYSVERGHKSMRYIETVATAWASDGITTVQMAKDATSRYAKDYYTVLKYMGIAGRAPIQDERDLIDTWIKTYGFDLEIIHEACRRTVLQTGQPSFHYADGILSDWNKHKVRNLADIQKMDSEHQKKKSSVSKPSGTSSQATPNNRFNNFHQRDYDFADYEKRLLNNNNNT